MTITKEAREQAVARALKAIGQLALLPEVTLRIIEIVEDPDSTAADLHAVIAKDPSLCTHILKVVNSSVYGLSTTIGSVERAIVVLGFSAIKNISTAASMSRLFEQSLDCDFEVKALWDHCNAVAVAAKLLADRLGTGYGEEAYLAGLLHDIGVVVELQYDQAGISKALATCRPTTGRAPAGSMTLAEDSVFGANHQDFGAGLCEAWSFPPALVAAVRLHHDPLSAPEELREFTSVIHAADALAGMVDSALQIELQPVEILAPVRANLGLTDELIASLLDDLGASLADDQTAA